ncbi:MAG: hypothetical protein AMXMBFR66_30250 [Pseudomonadota bacterium]|nr:hypothetical protein [Rubrivivax sp.]
MADLPVPRGRLDALADGVCAIAVTRLVLELRLPALAEGASDAALGQAPAELGPKMLVWLLCAPRAGLRPARPPRGIQQSGRAAFARELPGDGAAMDFERAAFAPGR